MCVHNWMWISCLVNINMRHFGHNVRSSIRDLEVFVKCQSCYATYEHNQGHRQRVDSGTRVEDLIARFQAIQMALNSVFRSKTTKKVS